MKNQELKSALFLLRNRLDISWPEVARIVGVSLGALEGWLYGDSFPTGRNLAALQKFAPDLFSQFSQVREQIPDLGVISVRPEVEVNPVHFLLMKELTKDSIAVLVRRLAWFLFRANVEQRNQLREEMADRWETFLNLTRAIAGEKAFEVVLSEGLLKEGELKCDL